MQKGGYNKEVSQGNLILGRSLEMKGDYLGALQIFEAAENHEIFTFELAVIKMLSGNVLMLQENYPEALSRFQQSYDLYQSVGDTFYSGYCLFSMSDLMFQLGNFEEAKAKLLQAQTIINNQHPLFSQLNSKLIC